MSSARDRLAWQGLTTHEPAEIVDAARKLHARARNRTAQGSGFELTAIAGNDRALAALSLLLAHAQIGSVDAAKEQALQRQAGVTMAVFRSSLQALKRALGLPTTPSRSARSTPRKKDALAAGSTPTTTPTRKANEAHDHRSDDEEVIVQARKTPTTASGSKRTSARRSAAVESLARSSGSRRVDFEPDPLPSSTGSRKRRVSAPEPEADEELPPTPTKKRGRKTPLVTPTKERVVPAREPTPTPPEPLTIFDGEYVPLPSQAERWQEAPWHVDYDDLMWQYDAEEEGERLKVLREWDAWHTAQVCEAQGWTVAAA